MTGSILAIADKLDTMVGLFGIGQPPTGSKDPFALRRSAIGILKILIGKNLDLNILETIKEVVLAHKEIDLLDNTVDQVFGFLLERFRSWYLEEGISSEVFQSVFAVRPQRPLDFHKRIQAVDGFSKLPESANLAAANKRVSNLLSKQNKDFAVHNCDKGLLHKTSEEMLYRAIQNKTGEVAPYYKSGDYANALRSLSSLKDVVDEFFDTVLVMDEDEDLRRNRLCLLQELRDLFLQTADISFLDSN